MNTRGPGRGVSISRSGRFTDQRAATHTWSRIKF